MPLAFPAAAWVAITIQSITVPVPEFDYYGIPGAVQSAGWIRQKPAGDPCPVYDGDTVIGFSLGCRDRHGKDFPSPAALSK